MGAGREIGLVLVPELRRLVAEIPGAGLAARAEHAPLGAGRLLVAADAGDDSIQLVLGDGLAQTFGLARRPERGRRQPDVDLLQPPLVSATSMHAVSM